MKMKPQFIPHGSYPGWLIFTPPASAASQYSQIEMTRKIVNQVAGVKSGKLIRLNLNYRQIVDQWEEWSLLAPRLIRLDGVYSWPGVAMKPDEYDVAVKATVKRGWSPSWVLLTCRSRYNNEFAGFIESGRDKFAVILASQSPTILSRETTETRLVLQMHQRVR